jgi:tetratricopeptide (TPR) repeat protein
MTDAVSIAEEALKVTESDGARFLIEEAIGRQFAYSERWQDALKWMGNALNRETDAWPLLRRNLLITVSGVVARYDTVAATHYSAQAVAVAEPNLEPVRVAEAGGEHAIALWVAGHREEAFSAWELAIEKLPLKAPRARSDTQTILAFFHATGYFSSIAVHGCPPNDEYGIPSAGFFLSLDHIPPDLYKPIKEKLFFAQMAMFADGVGRTHAAGKWMERAMNEPSSDPGQELLLAYIQLAVTPAILAMDYRLLIRTASMTSANFGDSVDESLEALDLKQDARDRTRKTLSDLWIKSFYPSSRHTGTMQ